MNCEQVKENPSLYPSALMSDEGELFHWHTDANVPHSSQVFCVSAFGSIRKLRVKDQIIGGLLNVPEFAVAIRESIALAGCTPMRAVGSARSTPAIAKSCSF